MRRIICLALAAIMLIALAACGEEPQPADSTNSVTEPAAETTAATEAAATEETVTEAASEPAVGSHDIISLDFIQTFDQTPVAQEQKIYEKDGIGITVSSIRYDSVSGPQIMLAISNDSDSDLLIQNHYTTVNGFMMKPDLDVKIQAHKKAETPMSLPYLGLALADIRSLAEVEFSLNILDSKTFAVVDTTDTVQLKLTGASEQPPYDASGQTAYDAKGVKVILQGVKQDTLLENRSALKVYMENNTGKTVSVQNTTLKVNGYDITTAMHTVLLPGKHAVDMIELFDSELEECGVTSIDNIKVAFDINDYDVWKVIDSSDVVSAEIPTEISAEEAQTQPVTE